MASRIEIPAELQDEKGVKCYLVYVNTVFFFFLQLCAYLFLFDNLLTPAKDIRMDGSQFTMLCT